MDAPHKAVHEHGRNAMLAMKSGDIEKALKLLTQTEEASMEVLYSLDRLAEAGEKNNQR
ncbi:MAG: hypothetical protein WC236_07275 [Gallionellaceae bacterium]|jgi:methyl-accepting chemotaxis protein